MKITRLLLCLLAFTLFAPGPKQHSLVIGGDLGNPVNTFSSLRVPVIAVQAGVDCSSGCNGPTGEKWSDTQGNCVSGDNQSCGEHCTCQYGFLLSGASGNLTPKWFNISIRDGQARLGEPGPLLRHRCQKGDSIFRINGRKPTHALFTKYTRKSPARYAEATWDAQGKLHLRLWR